MTDKTTDDKALEALFESAREDSPEPSQSFLARLEADALDATARHSAPAESTASSASNLGRWLTGLFPVSGLAAATIAGVWIGFQMPSSEFGATLLGESSDFDVSAFLPAVGLEGFSGAEADG